MPSIRSAVQPPVPMSRGVTATTAPPPHTRAHPTADGRRLSEERQSTRRAPGRSGLFSTFGLVMRIPRPLSRRAPSAAATLAIALFAAACGGAGSTATDTGALTPVAGDESAPAPDDDTGPTENDDAGADDGVDPADPAPTDPLPSDPADGTGGSSVIPAGQVDPVAAATAAEANIDGLRADGDVRLTQLLNVADGTPASISDAVDGDRPVLLWFWAPH